MTVFWVSFRIDNRTVGGLTYNDRYDSLINALERVRSGHWWGDTTSFFLVESNLSTSQVAAALKPAIATSVDLVLVGSMQHTTVRAVGKVENMASLRTLVPDLGIA